MRCSAQPRSCNGTTSFPMPRDKYLLSQEPCQLAARAKEQNTYACRAQSRNLGDFLVSRAFCVCQPQELTLPRTHTLECRTEQPRGINSLGSVLITERQRCFRHFFQGSR